MTHGTTNAYQHGKCRCADCRAAWAAYVRQRKADTSASDRKTRAPKPAAFIELVRWERTPDGAQLNTVRGRVIKADETGWHIFVSADDWVEAIA